MTYLKFFNKIHIKILTYYNIISNEWKDNGFEVMLIAFMLFIFIAGVIRKSNGNKGTWSKSYYVSPYSDNRVHAKAKPLKRKGPPKDSKGEIESRRVLEDIFQTQFDRIRPDFLRNPISGGGHNLELDCYNGHLKLACEYSGKQHYEFIPFFHKNKEMFMNQKYRDLLKADLCKKHGINLIVVPYYIDIKDIKGFIYKELRAIGYDV